MNDLSAMIPPEAQSRFTAGMARALRHWLAFWQQSEHDVEARCQACGHALRALTWGAEWGQDAEAVADLILAMREHMLWAGQWADWELCLRHVLDRTRSHISDDRRYELQHCLAALYFRLHRLDEAIALARENERLAVALGDVVRQERVEILLAETYLNAPQFDLARACATRALELATVLGDRVLEADALIDLARALLGQGRITEAERHLARACELATAAGNAIYQCKATLFQGHAAGARQAWGEALARFTEALALVQSYGDEIGRGVALGNMGHALLELGRWDEAGETLEAALRSHRFHGNAPAERVCQERLAELHARCASAQEDRNGDGISPHT